MKQITIMKDGFYNGYGAWEKKAVLLHEDDVLNVIRELEHGDILAETTVENHVWGIPVGTVAVIEANNFVIKS